MRACIQSIADKEKTLITADRAIQSARQTIAEAEAIIAKGEDIRQAQGAIETLGTRRADAEARLRSFQQAHKAVLEARRPETPSSQRSRRKSPAGRSASPTTPNGRPCSKTADARPRRTRPAISSKTPLRQRTASKRSGRGSTGTALRQRPSTSGSPPPSSRRRPHIRPLETRQRSSRRLRRRKPGTGSSPASLQSWRQRKRSSRSSPRPSRPRRPASARPRRPSRRQTQPSRSTAKPTLAQRPPERP